MGHLVAWRQPVIRRVGSAGSQISEEGLAAGELTPEELETRGKHLEALGHIN